MGFGSATGSFPALPRQGLPDRIDFAELDAAIKRLAGETLPENFGGERSSEPAMQIPVFAKAAQAGIEKEILTSRRRNPPAYSPSDFYLRDPATIQGICGRQDIAEIAASPVEAAGTSGCA